MPLPEWWRYFCVQNVYICIQICIQAVSVGKVRLGKYIIVIPNGITRESITPLIPCFIFYYNQKPFSFI